MAWKGECLGSNVVVEVVENEQISDGGLYFTTIADKTLKWGKGKVVSAGESIPLNGNGLPCIKEGDFVIFDTNKSTPFMEDSISYEVIMYGDLMKVY